MNINYLYIINGYSSIENIVTKLYNYKIEDLENEIYI